MGISIKRCSEWENDISHPFLSSVNASWLPKKSKPDYFKDDSFKFHSLIINNCIGTMSSLTLILEIQVLEALESLLFLQLQHAEAALRGRKGNSKVTFVATHCSLATITMWCTFGCKTHYSIFPIYCTYLFVLQTCLHAYAIVMFDFERWKHTWSTAIWQLICVFF